VSNLDNGDTYFIWTVENASCSNSATVKVTDNYYNTTAAAAGPNTLCVDYSPIIGGVPPVGGSGKWTSTSADVTFDNDSQVSTTARGLPNGTSSITWTVTYDGCEAPASFSLLNNSIYTSAGDNQIVCQDNTNLNAQEPLAGETGTWTVDNMNAVIANLNDHLTEISNLDPGDNIFTWTLNSTNGCSAVDAVIISDNSFTVTAGNNDIACGPAYTGLAGSDPLTGTGVWTVSSGTGSFESASSYETTVNGLSNGNNTLTWTVLRNGCEDDADVIITNDLYPAVAGDSRSVCSDQTTVSAQPLNSVWGATGAWTVENGGGVFDDPAQESTLITGLANGDNRLRWTVSKGACSAFDEIVIANNSITASAGTPQITCDNFATLSATPLSSTGVGIWSGGGAYTVIVNPSSETTQVIELQQGVNTFAWTVTDNSCTGTSTVSVTSNYFEANAGANQVVTANSATMAALLPDAAATGTWTPFSGSGNFADNTNPTEVVTDLGYGENTFRWEVDWNSCVAYDDVVITYNALDPKAGPDQAICESSTSLNAEIPFIGTGIWSLVEGTGDFADPTDPKTIVSGILLGSVNTYRWTVEKNNYSVYDDVVVTNNDFVISAGANKEECINRTRMTAENPGTGTGMWTVLTGSGNFIANSLNTTEVENLGEGANLFVWTVEKNTGCINSDTVQVIYNLPPTASFEMDQTEGCAPIDVEFTNVSTGGVIYYWNFGEDFRTDTELESFSRTYVAKGDGDTTTYAIRLVTESIKGCTDTVIHEVYAYGIPDVEFSVSPTIQLFPKSTVSIENLSGENYVNYHWDFGDGKTELDSKFVPARSHTYNSWGVDTITLSVFSNNCSSTATQIIEILAPIPETTLKPALRADGCADLSVSFEHYVRYADTLHWEFGDGGSSEDENPTYIYDTPGTYVVTLTAGGPGTADTMVVVRRDTVKVYEVPVADFEVFPDTVMLPDQEVICNNNSINGDRYQWNFGEVGNTVSTEESPEHYYTEAGIYTITLEVWSVHDCYHSKSIENAVVVEKAGTYVFPTGISPQGKYDINRIFKPKHRGIRDYKLEIYNRWGEKVFESTDPDFGWDGFIDGKLGAQDVYAWKVAGTYKNGSPFKSTGNVTLLR